MKKVIVYGASDTGKKIYNKIKDKYQVICFVDDNQKLIGSQIFGLDIENTETVYQKKDDFIILAVLSKYEKVKKELIKNGVAEEKIIEKYIDLPNRAREDFVKNVSLMFAESECAIAEVGVYQGEFSKVIGHYFPNNTFYLFDTFEGFPEKDVFIDTNIHISSAQTGYFSDTSVDVVLSKIKNIDRCVVKKGYFPYTTEGINDKFIFVNLDADLYQPTKEGLLFFKDRMHANGGIILIHDYFSKIYCGVKKAVDEFCKEYSIFPIPIGDTLSVAIFIKK